MVKDTQQNCNYLIKENVYIVKNDDMIFLVKKIIMIFYVTKNDNIHKGESEEVRWTNEI